jgi:hypothetical protein
VNLTRAQLETQYQRGVAALPFVHDVERRYGLPPYLLFAVWSRETDVDLGYLHGKTGDYGYGHGPWQLDNHPQNTRNNPERNAECARIDAGDMVFAAEKAAGMLAANLTREAGNLVRALNRYNSGSPNTSDTTGRDYGPDVAERRLVLEEIHGQPPRPRKDDDMGFMQGSVRAGEHVPVRLPWLGTAPLEAAEADISFACDFEDTPARIVIGDDQKGYRALTGANADEVLVKKGLWVFQTAVEAGDSICSVRNKGKQTIQYLVRYRHDTG